MFDGILTPAFLQSACAHVQPTQNVIYLFIGNVSTYDLNIEVSYIDVVTVEYTEGGVIKSKTITGNKIEDFTPDALSVVTITGNVTRMDAGAPSNGAIKTIDADDCKSLMSLVTSPSIETLKISKYLTSLDIRGKKITTVYYPANNNAVSTTIANAITNADANNGTVYTREEAKYYATIETAADDKGWTIEELN